jgi:hypothetical protein
MVLLACNSKQPSPTDRPVKGVPELLRDRRYRTPPPPLPPLVRITSIKGTAGRPVADAAR